MAAGTMHLDILSKPGRIIISRCLCVAKSFHDRVCSQNLLFSLTHPIGSCSDFSSFWFLRILDRCKVPHYVFSTDRFPGPGLPTDDDGLVCPISQHASVRILGNGEQMGLHFSSFATTVGLDNVLRV